MADLVSRYIAENGVSVTEFEDEVGWGFSGALEDPRQFWLWNVDGLRDLSAALNVPWLAVLPRELPPPGFPLRPVAS